MTFCHIHKEENSKKHRDRDPVTMCLLLEPVAWLFLQLKCIPFCSGIFEYVAGVVHHSLPNEF